ncbi:MAG: 16S rRNA (cytosine(1402)-N(4))-methyltransferase RsmH [Candidatus Pacebacteria bacterium]|nr:16S rRNA (cytosine(1402)-N(4))-methyltransferase RsmH [Candidatus Paceibacterota bacterium]
MSHIPVLLKEVMNYLDPKPGDFIIDGTFGEGGYTSEILKAVDSSGTVLAVDLSPVAIKNGKDKFKKDIESGNLIFKQGNFSELGDSFVSPLIEKADGLVLDLGFSSSEIEDYGRGFSFMRDEPLLMTYEDSKEPLRDALRRLKKDEIEKILRDYSGERFARKIAESIWETQRKKPIETTFELVDAVKKTLPKNYEMGRIHPATRTFLAFRIFINDELGALEKILRDSEHILKHGGRIVVVSFQSLEDKIVKNEFKNIEKTGKGKILTKKPIPPDRKEILENRRSRSAKLRALEVL